MEQKTWASPLKQPKAPKKDAKPEEFKKDKCVVKASCVKKLTGISDADEVMCRWVERYIDQLVRENSYPPQLRSNEFYSLLGTYFGADTILPLLERTRNDFARAFPLANVKVEDALEWLPALLRSDPAVVKDLPKDYLL